MYVHAGERERENTTRGLWRLPTEEDFAVRMPPSVSSSDDGLSL